MKPWNCVPCFAMITLTSCISADYRATETGDLQGKLRVEWVGYNRFVYRPDAHNPLRYVTPAGDVIKPQLMYTDGGSIPAFLSTVPGFSPWGYAPAYVIHDWLFEQHHCRIGDWDRISFVYAADILAQVAKTLMQKGAVPSNPPAIAAIYFGVETPIAREIWEDGQCLPVPAASPVRQPVVVAEIDFGPSNP